MIPNLLIAAQLEATAQWIVAPGIDNWHNPAHFESHLQTVRKYVAALYRVRNAVAA